MPYKDPEARKRYQREWIAARRAAYFAGKSCVECGATDGLELDHIDPSIKVDHKVWSWSEERRQAELAKCQVLCSTCHLNKTTGGTHGKHGSAGFYASGCRCAECRAYHSRMARRWRRRSPSSP